MNNYDQQIKKVLYSFKLLLSTEKVGDGTVRSYLSDTRHFIAWLTLFQKSNRQEASSLIDSLCLIRKKTLEHYLAYLVQNTIPQKTVNRRLSSLRKFGAFCVSQGWLADNYFAYLKNIPAGRNALKDLHSLNAYRQNLINQGNSDQTVRSYLSDARHFIKWMNS